MTNKGQIMTTLNEIMSPKSIAIVGASDNKGRIGGRPLAHMIEQKFSGGIFPINPNRDTVQGIKAYPSLLDVKGDLDFILVAKSSPKPNNNISIAGGSGTSAVTTLFITRLNADLSAM